MVEEMQNWYDVTSILKNHKERSQEEARKLIPGQEEWIQKSENSQLVWKPRRYRITSDRMKRKPIRSQSKLDASASRSISLYNTLT